MTPTKPTRQEIDEALACIDVWGKYVERGQTIGEAQEIDDLFLLARALRACEAENKELRAEVRCMVEGTTALNPWVARAVKAEAEIVELKKDREWFKERALKFEKSQQKLALALEDCEALALSQAEITEKKDTALRLAREGCLAGTAILTMDRDGVNRAPVSYKVMFEGTKAADEALALKPSSLAGKDIKREDE